MNKHAKLAAFLFLFLASAALALAQQGAVAARASSPAPAPSPASTSVDRLAASVHDNGAWRIEGETRFRANCGRCHVAPHKFPPREMAMIVRHMRVRAMLTDEDTKLILRYMTQ